VTVIRPSRARCVKGTYHATSVLSLTARHPARAERTLGIAERPLHFLSNLRDDVDARGFL